MLTTLLDDERSRPGPTSYVAGSSIRSAVREGSAAALRQEKTLAGVQSIPDSVAFVRQASPRSCADGNVFPGSRQPSGRRRRARDCCSFRLCIADASGELTAVGAGVITWPKRELHVIAYDPQSGELTVVTGKAKQVRNPFGF